MKSLLTFAAIVLLGTGCNQETAAPKLQPDNTAINERDAGGVTKTPLDQSNTEGDIDLVAKIRSDVVEMEDLSSNAHNVKIITDGGKVTLRGPVDSDAERDAIVQVANDAAGAENVVNEIEVNAE